MEETKRHLVAQPIVEDVAATNRNVFFIVIIRSDAVRLVMTNYHSIIDKVT